MMFSKNINNVENIGFEKDIEDSKDYDLDDGDEKKYRLLGLRQRGGAWRREQRPRMYYPIYINPKDGSVSLEKTEMFTIESLPKRPSGDESRWTWGKELFTKNKNKLIGKKVNRTGESEFWDIFRKDYLEDEEGAIALKKVKSIWDDKETNYQNGRNEIKELFGNSEIFDFPKPTYLVRKIISMFEFDNDIVLDFFSGSGTTAQAIIRLNYEDGENRKFILVQIPELTFEKSEAFKAGYKKISDITIERNKRVIEKIEKEDSEKDPSLIKEENIPFKTGFKVYKLAKSNFPRVDFASDPNKSDKENIKLLNQYIEEKEKSFFSKLDDKVIFDEVLLKNGFMLNYSLEVIKSFTKNKIYKAKDDFKECLICLDSEIAKQTLKELENHRDIIFICLERSLDTTMKWNLKHLLGDKLIAF